MSGKKPNHAREAARRAAAADRRPPSRPRDVHPEVWDVMQRHGVDVEQAYRILAAQDPDQVLDGLRAVAAELRQLDRRRHELVARRDELVSSGRVAGVSWTTLARAAGTTRPALIQRRSDTPGKQ